MSLLEEIQNEAVDSNTDLGMLLRKLKVLAARLGSEPLENWLIWESNGYPDDVQVPDYRIWSLEVTGHFSGPLGSNIRNAPIPLACLPEKTREYYERYQCRMSIAGVEAALKGVGDGMVQISTRDLAIALGTKVYQGYNCVQAWAEFSTNNLVELLNAVRNRILDFSLAIWKENPIAGEASKSSDSSLEPAVVTQIFHTTVYGGTASLIGSAYGSSVVFNIVPNDFPSLEAVLRENGLQQRDIEELSDALNTDAPPTERDKFGPAVSSWIAKMVQKAAEGGWKISVGAAGTLLAQAISKFYGL
jgi:hypothetical protein